ncbi:MAG: hypothetical protein Q8891_12355 [Bacteroidota bacterium]|nr:hypothetical protein [Bacteroidota bacterium]
MKKCYLLLLCSFCFICGGYAQTAIDPNGVGGFDAGNTFASNGWTVVNSSANKWVVGTTTNNSPPNSAYISRDSIAATPGANDYDYDYDNTTTHISHFYRQVTLPPEAFNISLSFYLQGNVQSDNELNVIDGLNVYTDETTIPVADALPGPSAVIRFPQFNSQLVYSQQGASAPDLAGKTFYLIFTWVNNDDGTGDGPPASIDDISLTYCIKSDTFRLTGGGGFCIGSDGTHVGLAGSTKAISYQLYNNGTPVGDPVAGTGDPLDFGLQTAIGNYTVVGTSACGYTYPMPGSVDVTENPLPVATAGSNAPICTGATLNLTSGPDGETSYSWSGPNSFNSSDQNPSIPAVTINASGTYKVTVTDNNGCSANATTEVTLTSGGAIGGTITSVSICSGDNGSLSLSGNSNSPLYWESSTDSTSASWTNIPNTTTTLNFSGVTVPTFYRAVVSNGCGSINSSIGIVWIHNYWVGGDITSPTDWNTATNWSDGQVPSAATCPDVYIPATLNQPVLSTGPVATIINLHIASGASVTINGTGFMQIGGTIYNSGVFDITNGTLELNGTSIGTQNIDGNTFANTIAGKNNTIKNLIISNNVDVANTPNDTLNISGSLSFGNTSADLNTGDNITLKSSATATANVGVLAAGNTITGEVTVERYLNTGTGGGQHAKAWEFLAIPTMGQTVKESWMEGGATPTGYGTQVTGAGGAVNGFDLASPSPSMKYYNPSNSLGWTGIANTGISIYNQKGYMLFVRGDRSVDGKTTTTPNATTLRTKGNLLTGKVTIPVGADAFGSIGNPYASAIDMRKVMADREGNVNEFFTVWNANLGGTYGYGGYETYYYDGTNYTNIPSYKVNNHIQSGEAFFVQTTGGTGNMVFNETSKDDSSSINIFRPQSVPGKIAQLRTQLYSVFADGSTYLDDGTLHQFSDNYSNAIDGMDGRKVFNSSENLYLHSGGKNLIVERRHGLIQSDTLFYNLASVKAQNYRMEFIASSLSSYGLEGFIEDTYLHTKTPLNLEGTTLLNFSVTNAAGSYATNRFRIVFAPMAAGPLPVTFVSVNASLKNGDIAVEWKVENESNMSHYEVEQSIDGNRFTLAATVTATNLDAGAYSWLDENVTPGYHYYRIKSVDINGTIAYTQVVKVWVPAPREHIAIYPNPITDGVIHLQMTNLPKGRYGIRLLNKLGQVIVQKQINHPGGSTTQLIQWDYNLAHGMYQVEIIRPDGTVKDLNVMY